MSQNAHRQYALPFTQEENESMAFQPLGRGLSPDLPCMWFVVTPDGKVCDLSNYAAEQLDRGREALRDQTVAQFFHRDDRTKIKRLVKAAQAHPDRIHSEKVRIAASKGGVIPVNVRLRALKNAEDVHGVSLVCEPMSGIQTLKNELAEYQGRYRTLVEHMKEGIMEVDAEDVIRFVNDRYCEMVGYSREELIGQAAYKLFLDEEDRPFMLKKLKLREQGVSDEYEIPVRKKSGEKIWVRIVGTPVTDAEGRVVGSVGIHTDLTEPRQARAALKESEARFRLAVENYPHPFVIYDSERRIQYINRRGIEYSGYRESDILGKRDEEVFPPEVTDSYLPILEQVFETRSTQSVECRIQAPKTTFDTIVTYVPVLDEEGNIRQVFGMAHDITAIRQAERALRESEKRYRQLLNHIPVGIYQSTPDGKFLAVNSALVRMLGYGSEEELMKIDIPKQLYFSPDERKKVQDNLREQGRECSVFRLRKKDGSELWAEDYGHLELDEQGRPLYYQGVLLDITERKNLEEELARAQRLETAGRVAGQIAHDFNNLLAPLAAYPALIREDLDPNHPVVGMIAEMEAAAKKIGEINQQLLALGRRGHYAMEVIDLNDLVQNLLLSQPLPNEIEVMEEFNEELLPIRGGAAQLTRALTNLLNNAKEAMQGSGTLTVSSDNVYLDKPLKGYQTLKRGEYVRLDISDSGDGIAPEILNKIFDPFFTTKRMDRMRGSGLGLSIVHGIMEDHKGYITVKTVPGQGTTFSLYFPVARDREPDAKKAIVDSRGGHERVLVVDDDPVQRRVAGQLLKRLGYKVHAVASGEQAIEYVRQHQQDLLLLDMVMDGIDGAETYRRILEFRPDQKAIILSGYAMSQRVQEALRLGASAFLPKPVTLNNLASVVRNTLDGKPTKSVES